MPPAPAPTLTPTRRVQTDDHAAVIKVAAALKTTSHTTHTIQTGVTYVVKGDENFGGDAAVGAGSVSAAYAPDAEVLPDELETFGAVL